MMVKDEWKDEWVRAAMMDDAVVVELLVRLKQSQETAAVKSTVSVVVPLPSWGVRQPRSRLRCDAVSQRKEGDSTRCSPTTPLSWSGGSGASPSGTADGFEESSRPTNRSPAGGRSKGFAATETTSISTKRSRRKKTYSQLKEEESSLLKEKIYLKKELATIRATIKEQRTRNESLKRMKLDLDLHSTKNMIATSYEPGKATSNQPNQRLASTCHHAPSTLLKHATCDDLLPSDSCQAPKAVSKQDSLFALPDLNMMPTEEDSGSEILCGMS